MLKNIGEVGKKIEFLVEGLEDCVFSIDDEFLNIDVDLSAYHGMTFKISHSELEEMISLIKKRNYHVMTFKISHSELEEMISLIKKRNV